MTQLAKTNKDLYVFNELTQAQQDMIRNRLCVGATADQISFFLAVASSQNLNPFAGEIYAIPFKNYDAKNRTYYTDIAPVISIDTFRARAALNPRYLGQTPPEWCDKDGNWTDVWLKDGFPAAARCGVYLKDAQLPTYAVATWSSYVNEYIDHKTKQKKVNSTWSNKPDVMLSKCAEALALRKACPHQLAKLYIAEEFSTNAVEQQQLPTVELISNAQLAEVSSLVSSITTDNGHDNFDWAKRILAKTAATTTLREIPADLFDDVMKALEAERKIIDTEIVEATLVDVPAEGDGAPSFLDQD